MDERYVLIIVGTLGLCYGLVSALRLKASGSWPFVQGRIVRSSKRIRDTDAGKLEEADIAYEYVFGEKRYTCRVVKIGGDLLSRPAKRGASEADLLLAKYRVGAPVSVYVNPRHPKVACLERAGAETVFISTFFGLLAIITGLYLDEIMAFINDGLGWLRR